MIGVVGATGRVGGAVAAQLAAQGVEAVAIVRRADAAVPLAARVADLSDLAATRAAFTGVSRLFLLTPHSAAQSALEAGALQAAVDAGVSHIVKVSGGVGTLGPNGTTATAVAHWRSEQAIEQSGVGFTFLRPSFYMQNLLESVAPVAARVGLLPAPFGAAPVAMVDVRDVAASAVAALIAPPSTASAWTLTGPRAVSFAGLGEQLGMRTMRVSLAMTARSLRRSGASHHEVEHALRMARYFATGSDASPTDHVEQLTGRPARPVEEFLSEHRSAFAPATPVARAINRRSAKESR